MGKFVLGLDLGVSSLGWAIVERIGSGKKGKVIDAGVRIFEAGVEGAVEQGKDSSRGVKRREARQPRRQQWRRQQRKQKLFQLLQEVNLLPPSDSSSPSSRKAVLDALDAELRDQHLDPNDHLQQQKLPYILRAAAAKRAVGEYELGRALYHLGQRRGYLSNRKSQDDEESAGAVALGIGEIDEAKGDCPLGEFFANDVDVFALPPSGKSDPRKGRIRSRYTSRSHYQDEFRRIKEAQKKAHRKLSEADWKRIYAAIFFQRPLKSQKHLIGRCELIPGNRRCPEALPVFQEFRILQAVNHLRVRLPDYTERELEPKERERLIDALRTSGEISLKSTAKKVCKLPKGAVFTLEEWQDKLVGHRTNQKMLSAFGERWFDLTPEERDEITLEVLHFRKPQALKKRAREAWGLDEEQAETLSRVRLEEGYASHSREALQQLVDAMRDGTPYQTAHVKCFPESIATGEPLDRLPPVNQWDADIRNPAVIRALSEVRKVVNAVIQKYAKPDFIHIELARDLKNSREKRKNIWKTNEENRKRREQAIKDILREAKLDNPSRSDVEKWLLAEEADWTCPYCGTRTSPQALFGNSPFDIEHIYPRRYLDNSYMNKTIACRPCNHRKGDRCPAEVFAGEELEQILQRVRDFKGSARFAKLKRFETVPNVEDFVSRDLNDTRYNSRLAAQYLGTLYGGRSDAQGRQRVLTPTGSLTALLRYAWGLNGIISDDDNKNRDDLRHHAIDALVVAISTQGLVQDLSHAAQAFEGFSQRDRAFLNNLEEPFEKFTDQVRQAIAAIQVSHRATRTLAGPLHAESIYSKEIRQGEQSEYRIRKALHKLNAKEITSDQIVDPTIRRLVQLKYEELGGGLPSKVFSDPTSHPTLATKDGRHIPIHKVRIRASAVPRSIGKGIRQRNVASGKNSNFASMVYAVFDAHGNEEKWIHEIITRLEAHERLSANHGQPGEKVLIPNEQNGERRFKFALIKNDMLLLEGPEGEDELYRVQKISRNEIQLCPHSVGTVENNMRTKWNQIQSIDNLRKRNARRVEVTTLGDLRPKYN